MDIPNLRIQTMAKRACGHAINILAEHGEPMLPFLMAQTGDDVNAKMFSGDTLEESLARARAEGATMTSVDCLALGFAAYVTVEGVRSEGVLVEICEPGSERSFVFAQRYRPARFRQPVTIKGRPQLIADNGAPLFAAPET